MLRVQTVTDCPCGALVRRMRVQNLTMKIHFPVPKCLCKQGTKNVLNNKRNTKTKRTLQNASVVYNKTHLETINEQLEVVNSKLINDTDANIPLYPLSTRTDNELGRSQRMVELIRAVSEGGECNFVETLCKLKKQTRRKTRK